MFLSEMSEGGTSSDNGGGANADPASLIATFLGGPALYGGLGWLLDRGLGFQALFLPIGFALGLAGAIYLIYLRYVRS